MSKKRDGLRFLSALLLVSTLIVSVFAAGCHTAEPVYTIKVIGGILDGGASSGTYKEGMTVTVTADAPASGMEFSHFTDSKGNTVSKNPTVTLQVYAAETYTAVYRNAIITTDSFSYRVNADGKTCMVTGMGAYSGTDIKIPEKIDGYMVTDIADGAFQRCESLTSVKLPSTLTAIGKSAFESCRALGDIVIPESVTEIGESAFYECESLTVVDIPNGVTEIGNFTFEWCKNLQQVILGSRTVRIGDSACKGCANLQSVYIPRSVVTIGDAGFSECPKLANVFYDGTEKTFETMHIGPSNDKLHAANLCFYSEAKPTTDGNFWRYVDGVIILWGKDYTFLYEVNADDTCTLTGVVGKLPSKLEIPKNIDGYAVTEIGPKVFYGCDVLKELTVPSFIRKVERDAFAGCATLETVRYNSPYTPGYGKSILDEPSIKTAIFGGTAVPAFICNSCFHLKNIEILDSNTAIGESAFDYCYNVKEIQIPENVTTIESRAFSACQGLTSFRIPSSITEISEGLFSVNTGLSSVEIPRSVTKIGASAFWSCSNLHEIHLPDTIESIGKSAFSSCTGLKTVTVPSSVKTVEDDALFNCYHLQSIVFSEGLESLGNFALANCNQLKYAVLPRSLVSMGMDVFSSNNNVIVYYNGTVRDWKNIQFTGTMAETIPANRLYYYSETQPTATGNYWHWVDGVPTKW